MTGKSTSGLLIVGKDISDEAAASTIRALSDENTREVDKLLLKGALPANSPLVVSTTPTESIGIQIAGNLEDPRIKELAARAAGEGKKK